MDDVKLDELWLMVIRRKHCPSVVKEQKRVRDSMQSYGVGKEEVGDRSSYILQYNGAHRCKRSTYACLQRAADATVKVRNLE